MIRMNNDIVGACQKVSKPKAIAYIVTAGILLHPRHFRFPTVSEKIAGRITVTEISCSGVEKPPLPIHRLVLITRKKLGVSLVLLTESLLPSIRTFLIPTRIIEFQLRKLGVKVGRDALVELSPSPPQRTFHRSLDCERRQYQD